VSALSFGECRSSVPERCPLTSVASAWQICDRAVQITVSSLATVVNCVLGTFRFASHTPVHPRCVNVVAALFRVLTVSHLFSGFVLNAAHDRKTVVHAHDR